MNTLSDTDEGRARPSVWPVYLVGVIIGLYSVGFLGYAVLFPLSASIAREAASYASPEALPGIQFHIALAAYAPLFAVCGLFGVVTAVGLVRLRPWGWWCAVLWIVIYAAYYILGVIAAPVPMPMWSIAACVATIALLVWPLATRRRLFFPRA